ncbi:MAG TPA: efflux RND transporter periplasmic adaptor subunit [Polyangiaceae bacterium]|nr:efflux RND transporter periplasmic adaptor subunit [Polyangiaceae bacterium]
MNSQGKIAIPQSASQPAADDLGFDLPGPSNVSRKRMLLVGVAVLGVFGLAFGSAYLPRRAAQHELEARARAASHARPLVAVVAPKLVSSDRKLTLPGTLQPLEEALIYARATGYVRRWHVDIGAKVEKGALLAELDTPEIQQEIAQAQAALAQAQSAVVQAQASRGLAQIRLERSNKLVAAGVAAQQELDQNQAQATVNDADLKVAESSVVSQRANLRRLSELASFSRVQAPFSGTITQRSVETGSLVSAGGTPLFRLTATDPVRVYVQVPQDLAPSASVGAAASVRLREFPGQDFVGSVARTSGALDPVSRTLSVEIRVPNPEGKLLTGMAADVSLTLPSPHNVYQIPSTALVTDAKGVRVLLVDGEGRLHSRPVVIERDLGANIQLASGVTETDRVLQIASADFEEGQPVEIKR